MRTPNVKRYKYDPQYMHGLRTRAGCTQLQWSQYLHTSERTVRRIEKGEYRYDYATQYLAEATAAMLGVNVP